MIDDGTASDIAAQWHSVMTWNDPGVAMYSVTSTGKVHSEEHRTNLLAYIATCMPAARRCDERGEHPIFGETCTDDLELLAEWATHYEVESC